MSREYRHWLVLDRLAKFKMLNRLEVWCKALTKLRVKRGAPTLDYRNQHLHLSKG
jgi:hypothetical protein